MFSPIIDSTNKNNKAILEVMEKIGDIQHEIEKHHSKPRDYNFKQHLRYFKSINKKVHKMSKSLVTILSNMSLAMCHAFIKDQELLSPQVDVFDYSEDSKDKQPVHNLHVFSDEEEENVVKE